MSGFQPVAWIAAAGALGAVLRYAVTRGVTAAMGPGFPYGTLVVNVLGSLAIGVLFVLLWERLMSGDIMRLTLMVGLLGSFTTFSAFSLDTWILVQHGAWIKAAVNVLANVSICLLATWLGIVAAKTALTGG